MRLIDADELETAVIGECWYDNRDEDIAYDLVSNAPTIDTIKHGCWKPKRYSIHHMDYECSVCNICVIHGLMHNYCPNCGAKMQDEEEVLACCEDEDGD